MAWLRLSDAVGQIEITLFSEVLSRRRDLLDEGRAVLVTVDLRVEGEAIRITAQDVQDLERVAEEAEGGRLRIWLADLSAVAPSRTALGEASRSGRSGGTVSLIPMLDDDREVELALPGRWPVTPAMVRAVRAVTGVSRVEEV